MCIISLSFYISTYHFTPFFYHSVELTFSFSCLNHSCNHSTHHKVIWPPFSSYVNIQFSSSISVTKITAFYRLKENIKKMLCIIIICSFVNIVLLFALLSIHRLYSVFIVFFYHFLAIKVMIK